jgi:hypothetical protein
MAAIKLYPVACSPTVILPIRISKVDKSQTWRVATAEASAVSASYTDSFLAHTIQADFSGSHLHLAAMKDILIKLAILSKIHTATWLKRVEPAV